VKFDLKAYTPSLHVALTGFDNRRVLENFEMVYRKFYEGGGGFQSSQPQHSSYPDTSTPKRSGK
jgi:hypothetical protein